MPRVLCWFSCGAASAVAAKLAVGHYAGDVEVLYCDTLKYEHPDNLRFLKDISIWLGQEIKFLSSSEYKDIFDVFDRTGWLVGVGGARCTTELKKKVRRKYQRPDDIHVFGFTVDEGSRIEKLEKNEPDLKCKWFLREANLTKQDTLNILKQARIELPEMYKLGYKNNNCIGCVKGGSGYWNKIRKDFPETFTRMATQERKMNVAINKRYEKGKRIRVFLDELPENAGRYNEEPDIECGVLCINE